nr:hypothetical protein [Tanacetum cinerariifolium]
MKNSNMTNGNHITDEINVDLNVFRPLMLNMIDRHINNTDIVTIDKVVVDRGECSSRRRLQSHAVSATTFATPQYSASALERERTTNLKRRNSPESSSLVTPCSSMSSNSSDSTYSSHTANQQ